MWQCRRDLGNRLWLWKVLRATLSVRVLDKDLFESTQDLCGLMGLELQELRRFAICDVLNTVVAIFIAEVRCLIRVKDGEGHRDLSNVDTARENQPFL